MIITTTPTIEGRPISKYIGLIGTEITFLVPSLTTDISIGDFSLSLSSTPSVEQFETARNAATTNLINQAKRKGANAIVGVAFNFQMVGNKNQVLLSATGTSVFLEKTTQEKEYERFEQAIVQKSRETVYYIKTSTGEKGPVMLEDLVSLYKGFKVTKETMIREDESDDWVPLRNIIPG